MILLSSNTYKDILNVYAKGTLIAVILTLFLWKIKVLPNLSNLTGKEYLGFYYASYGPNLFLHGVIAYLIYKEDKIEWWKWGIILFITWWLYKKTTTLAPLLITLGIFIMYIVGKNSKVVLSIYRNDIIAFVMKHFAILMASFSVLFQLAYNYNKKNILFQKINELLSYRLSYGLMAFERYGITLLGQKIQWIHNGGNYFYLDSSYLNVLFGDGVLVLLIVCIGMDCINQFAVNKKLYYLQIGLIAFLLHCISDPQLISFRYNPFFMLIIPILYELKKGDIVYVK